MSVAIGPVLLLVASVLLCAVLVLAVFGIAVWLMRHQQGARDGSEGYRWESDPNQIAVPDGTSSGAQGK